MKKNLFYLFALICSMSLFMACSDDDELTPEPTPDPTPDTPGLVIDESVFGDYKGTLTIAISDVQVGTLSQKISVTQASDSTLNLSLTDFSFLGIEVGDVELADCEVTQDGEDYDFTGTTSLSVTGLTADVEGTGTVSAAGNISLNLDIAAVLGTLEQSVTVTYEGSKLTGDEGTEALITAFTFDSDAVTEQPTINEDGTITFKVLDGADITALVPTITVSEGATVTPASGEAQDFSNPVTYTVVSEDYGTTNTYTVSVAGTQTRMVYDFEAWTEGSSLYPDLTEDIPSTPTDWASCNDAVLLIKKLGALGGITYTGAYPVRPTDDSMSGSAVMIESVDTQGGNIFGQTIPKVTAGTIFLGSFNAMAALGDPMATTSFGITFTQKPVVVSGYYKYTPGTEFYNAAGELQADTKDECAISAVLYEVESDEETLNGSNIYTSDKIVAFAQFTSGEQVDEYTAFSLNLDYVKDYDASKKYKFAIIFSASKDGAAYNAAVGSKLLVDDVEVLCE